MGSRPSHVLRATPTINPLVSLHDPASTKSPTSFRQAQPSHQQAWRHPRIWTPPACTSQRLTSVLERTKTTQIQRIFKSCQANNHCQDDETRSHRTLLRPAPATRMKASDSSRPGSSRLHREEIFEEDQSREPPWIWKGRAEFFQSISSTNRRQIKRRKSTPQEDLSNILASSDFVHDSHLHIHFVL